MLYYGPFCSYSYKRFWRSNLRVCICLQQPDNAFVLRQNLFFLLRTIFAAKTINFRMRATSLRDFLLRPYLFLLLQAISAVETCNQSMTGATVTSVVLKSFNSTAKMSRLYYGPFCSYSYKRFWRSNPQVRCTTNNKKGRNTELC